MNPFLRSLTTGTGFKLLFAFILVALADFLFYDHVIGWTLGGFAIVVLGLTLLVNSPVVKTAAGKITALFALSQALLLIDYQDFLTLSLYILSMASLAVISRHGGYGNALDHVQDVGRFLGASILKVFRDFYAYGCAFNRNRTPDASERIARRWLLPLIFAGVFIALFVNANPVLTGWVDVIRWESFFGFIQSGRFLFWFVVLALVWPLLRPRVGVASAQASQGELGQIIGWLFTPESIVRSLIVFNLIFAVQTAMDMVYLWGGTALPDGLTYAEYAQRGAYPLIVTALLAAAFVLIALRGDERDRVGVRR